MRSAIALVLVLVVFLLTGCIREVRVYSADPSRLLRDQQRSRLTSDTLSECTQEALNQVGLAYLARYHPMAATELPAFSVSLAVAL